MQLLQQEPFAPGERIGFIAVSNEMPDFEEVNAAVNGAGRALGYICAPSLVPAGSGPLPRHDRRRVGVRPEPGATLQRPAGNGLRLCAADGAFYLFMRTPEPDAVAFCERAKKHEIFVVPGDDFATPGYVRIAYCVETAAIERALPAFRALAEEYGLKK